MENKKLIYVYTSTGQLVNNTPFIGEGKAMDFLIEKASLPSTRIDEMLKYCIPSGEKFGGYYLRTNPTHIFKSVPKQKFKTVKTY